MIGNPLIRPLNFSHHPGITKPDHGAVTRIGLGLDAPPAPVLPPQDRGHKTLPLRQLVAVSNQPHTPGRLPNVDHGRAEAEVLPADMSDVMDPGARRRQIPVNERHRSKRATDQPIDRVLGRQVVVTNDLVLSSQCSADRQVVKLTHQPGDRYQALVRRHSSRLSLLPRHMPIKVTEHFATRIVHTEIPRSPAPATGFEQPQQITHEPRASRGGTAHRVPDTNNRIDETSRQGRLRHPSTLPSRYLEFSITCRRARGPRRRPRSGHHPCRTSRGHPHRRRPHSQGPHSQGPRNDRGLRPTDPTHEHRSRAEAGAARQARYRSKTAWLSGVKVHSCRARRSSGSVSHPCQATSSGSGATISGSTASQTASQ